MEYEGRLHKLPVATVYVQAINHATEHRSQVATIMTQQGAEPPDFSGWAWGSKSVVPERPNVSELWGSDPTVGPKAVVLTACKRRPLVAPNSTLRPDTRLQREQTGQAA